MVEPTCVQVKKLEDSGFSVKYMQCDNAEWKLGVQLEYAAQDTPQQNHLTELKLALFANKGPALMIDANVPINVQYKECNEALMTATLTDGLTTTEPDGKFVTRCMYLLRRILLLQNIYTHGVRQG
eukprot:10460637-Ditylum_brightwellii.AAC.1